MGREHQTGLRTGSTRPGPLPFSPEPGQAAWTRVGTRGQLLAQGHASPTLLPAPGPARGAEPRQVFQVMEEQPPGTLVGTIQTRPGFTYRLSESHALFAINSSTGALYTTATIDRESLPSDVVNLVVLSSAPTYPTEVRVLVQDVNDNAPVFPDPSIVVTFKEDSSSGRQVILDTATDADIGSNGVDHRSYRIVRGNEAGRFRLDVTLNPSGEGAFLHLVSQGGLDREATPHYQLLVEVEDRGEPRRRGHLRVNVTVLLNISARDQGPHPRVAYAQLEVTLLDVNDEAPEFSQPGGYRVSVAEDAPPGTELLTLRASDGDLGDNGTVRFALREAGADQPAFRLDPVSGQLSTARPLDRETQAFYSLWVLASDLGTPPQSSSALVNVSLLDVNDHSPVFYPVQYFAHVRENEPQGSYVTTVSALDPDLGANGTVRYRLAAGDGARFQVHAQSGVVSTRAVLDREERTAYQLQVVATDGGRRQSPTQAVVTITVLDTQDSPPVFSQPAYSFVVFENVALGYPVGSVSASTVDLNSNISYLIAGGDPGGAFAIHPGTGQLTTASAVDREAQAFYQLTVVARAGPAAGERVTLRVLAKNRGRIRGGDVDEATVDITVLDANDPPAFGRGEYRVQVSEGVPPGTHVAFVSAFDADSVPSWSRFSYSLGAGNERGAFAVHPQTGQVTVAAELDREALPVYNLTVQAVDAGTPPATGRASLLVMLEDVNDNGPVLAVTEATVAENQRPGTPVLTLQCADPDLPPNQGPFAYQLLSAGPAGGYFSLSAAGVLTTAREIDREQVADFWLTVVTRDAGVPQMTSTGTVHVAVGDQNDNPSRPRAVDIFVNYYGRAFPGGALGSPQLGPPPPGGSSLQERAGSWPGPCRWLLCPSAPAGRQPLGKTCESPVDHCACDPCFHGGSCRSGVDTYYCLCPFVPPAQALEASPWAAPSGRPSWVLSQEPEAASLTVDSCSEAQEPGFCTVSNAALSDDWTLDVQPNPVSVGGVRSLEPLLQRRGQVESHDFVGCVMELAVNGRPLEPSQALASQGVLDHRCDSSRMPAARGAHAVRSGLPGHFPGARSRRESGGVRRCRPPAAERLSWFLGLLLSDTSARPFFLKQALGAVRQAGSREDPPPGPAAKLCSDPQAGWGCESPVGLSLSPRLSAARGRASPPLSVLVVPQRPLLREVALPVTWRCGVPLSTRLRHPVSAPRALSACRPPLSAVSADTALSLEGGGRLDYLMSQREKRDYLLWQSLREGPPEPFGVDSLEVTFRTRSEHGVLLHVQETSNYTTVKIKSGKVHFASDAGVAGKVERTIPEVFVADGHWHTFLVSKNGSSTVLSLDGAHSRAVTRPTQDFGGLSVLTISLGGIPPSQAHRDSEAGFQGCVASLRYGAESLPFGGKHSWASISRSDPSVQIGCRGPNVCASNPCWGELLCTDQWHAYQCVPPGDCHSQPCLNGGVCEPGALAGFTCTCPDSHTGRTCETAVACLGVLCPQGRVCQAGGPGGHVCVLSPGPEELSLPLWAVPAIVGSCATLLALLVLSLILCHQCRGRKARGASEQKPPKEKKKKKKGSENVAFDDPDHAPPYGDDM
ncbi:PREDICTED: protocadherin Fat 4, partial [Condylura cristata]|uniref:protocadherin Fat 4 n=1 Tax=Condylura cristata TaxID=143302 RepID=UPI000642899B